MTLSHISPAQARALMRDGATLIDIRDADEHARHRIDGAVNVPLSQLDRLPDGPLLFHCRSGARTQAHAGQLAQAANGKPCHIVDGGIDAWKRDGLPTIEDRRRPMEIMRQVQIVAGVLILTGIALGLLVSPGFFGLSAFVGAGLTFAGISGWCGMARLLGMMPWNRRAAPPAPVQAAV